MSGGVCSLGEEVEVVQARHRWLRWGGGAGDW